MRFAYADPPYLGCAVKHYGDHPEAGVYDTIDGHHTLIDSLADFDGWALERDPGGNPIPNGIHVSRALAPTTDFYPRTPVTTNEGPPAATKRLIEDSQKQTEDLMRAANGDNDVG